MSSGREVWEGMGDCRQGERDWRGEETVEELGERRRGISRSKTPPVVLAPGVR